MKKNKIFNLFLSVIVIIFTVVNSVSAAASDYALYYDEISINDKIANIGFNKHFSSDPKKDIANLFKKMDDYTEKQDFKRLKLLFSNEFINNDGFDNEIYFKAIKTAFSNYQYTSVNTVIKNISVFDNYAIAFVTENSEGETLQESPDSKDKGYIISSANIYYYLVKDGSKWKISSANVLDETCSLLYGEAKNVFFTLNVPQQVKSGTDYTASLSFSPMKEILVMASIYNEPVTFPAPAPKKETYKPVKNDCILERILTSNNNRYNEYAVASIGITRPQMTNKSISLKLVGTAYVIRRVNVLNTKPQNIVPDGKKIKQFSNSEEVHVPVEKTKGIK